MCGISGIYHPGLRAEEFGAVTRAMTADLIHRGPDEMGFFEDGPISLGIRRLIVMDLTTGSQPIANEDGNITVICNGEIYGFEEIWEELKNKGHSFKTHSDTEVLVHLYEEYGVRFFDHFDGMYALALWDKKKKRLIIGRDRFGIKPLFFTRPKPDGSFAFSSELKSLLNFPGASREIDPIAVDKFLAVSYIPHPLSIYKNIRKLSPGCFLLVENDQVTERRYWDLPVQTEYLPPNEALENLDAAISSSVKKMMRSDVPFGAFLSGGFDSSTVVFNMAQHTEKPFHTYSVRFKVKWYDEGQQARDTSNKFGTIHHEIWVNPGDVKVLPTLLTYFGEPYADPSMIPTYLMSKVAKENVTVVLTGDGGDEVYGGYETFCASLFAERAGKIPAPLRKSVEWLIHEIPLSTEFVGLNYKIRKFLAGCNLPPLDRHAMWRTGFNTHQRRTLYQPAFLNRLGENIDRSIFEHFSRIFNQNGHDLLTLFQYLDMRTYLPDNNLAKVDRMAMANSLEARIPMLDLGVLKAGLALPPELRVKGLQTKIGLRKLMNSRLPRSVLTMHKKGFGVPMAFWFQGPLKKYLEDTLHPERLKKTGIIQSEPVQEIIARHISGQGNFIRQLLNAVCLVHWFEECAQEVLV